MKSSLVKSLQIFSLTFFFLLFLTIICSAAAVDEAATITIPEGVLFRTIKDGLPISLEARSQYVQGDVTIQSLEKLQAREKSLFLQGVVASQNLTLNTTIAGRDISMNLGNVRLPVTCEIFLRFDSSKKVLFVTPRFPKPESLYTTDPADALLLLLSSLGEKEYPVELGSIQPIVAKVGAHNIPITLEPVDIQTQKGLLLIKMRPGVAKNP